MLPTPPLPPSITTTSPTPSSTTASTISIHPASFPTDKPTIHHLFTVYASNPQLSHALAAQDFTHELSSLPRCYAEPEGCILLAWTHDPVTGAKGAVGCICLRPLPELPQDRLQLQARGTSQAPDVKTCELKRLYTLPSHRGQGIGKVLVQRALEVAREKGYEEVKLDTLVWMVEARKLYGRLGFVACEDYHGGGDWGGGVVYLGRRVVLGDGEGDGT